jgi:hypothetical protein
MLTAFAAAVLCVSAGTGGSLNYGSNDGLVAKTERVQSQIEILKGKIEGLKDGDEAVPKTDNINLKHKQDAQTCEDGEISVCECHAAPPPPSKVTVGGDPIFTVGDKRNTTHVWLPFGEMTKLLQWTVPGGRTMELLGKTFHQVDGYDNHVTENEWFGQFVIKHGEQTVLDVSADQENLGNMKVVMDGKVAEPMPGEMVYTSETHHRVKFTVGQTPDTDAFTIKGVRGRRLLVDAGGLQLTINMAKAIKFDKELDRVKWAHLNVNLNNGLPAGSEGIFAELVGLQPLSEATKELLERPEWASDYASRRRPSKGDGTA